MNEVLLSVLRCQLTQVVTNAEARFNKSLRPRKPEGSLGRTAQDVHLDSNTAPELCERFGSLFPVYLCLGTKLMQVDHLAVHIMCM